MKPFNLSQHITRTLVNVLDYGALPGALTDATAAFDSAATLAAFRGVPLLVPFGTFVISNWILPAGLEVIGNGVLKRPNGDAGHNPVIHLQNGNNQISGITIDGNKANNSHGASSVLVTGGGNYVIDEVTVQNTRSEAGGYGEGIAVVTTSDKTDGTQTVISKCHCVNNDNAGIYVDEACNLVMESNNCSYNGWHGISFSNLDMPLEVASQINVRVDSNRCQGNGGSGISISGTGVDNIQPPIGSEPGQSLIYSDNVCTDNAGYGIACQAAGCSITGNICRKNGNDGGSRITFGGILGGGWGNVYIGNVCEANEFYGIDAGGSYACIFANNIIRYNGGAPSNTGTGLNLGASVQALVMGNSVIDNGGTAGGYQIAIHAYDNNGSNSGGMPNKGARATITGNYISMSYSAMVGIGMFEGVDECSATNNRIMGGDPNLAIIVESTNSYVVGNHHSNYPGGLVIASAAGYVIPDWLELMVLTGTVTCTNGIVSYSRNANSQKVSWITITNGGSGYTSPPSCTISGGGGTGATAQPMIGYGGKVTGIRMTNKGSGYTSAPSVAFSGGGGTGAAATANVGCTNQVARKLTILFAGNAPIQTGGGVQLAGSTTFTPGATGVSTLSLQAMYGTNWHETGRMIG